MSLKISNVQSLADVLRGWQGICREFGCSEEQLEELYHVGPLLSGCEPEPEFPSDAEFAEQASDCSRQPLN